MLNENLIRPNDLVFKHRHIKQGTLRAWIYKASENGLDESGALKRVGRSIYIDEVKFLEWFFNRNR